MKPTDSESLSGMSVLTARANSTERTCAGAIVNCRSKNPRDYLLAILLGRCATALMCPFLANLFLPHLPCTEVR